MFGFEECYLSLVLHEERICSLNVCTGSNAVRFHNRLNGVLAVYLKMAVALVAPIPKRP